MWEVLFIVVQGKWFCHKAAFDQVAKWPSAWPRQAFRPGIDIPRAHIRTDALVEISDVNRVVNWTKTFRPEVY